MERTVGDIVHTLYGTAVVIELLQSGVKVRIFKAYSNFDWLGKELILEN